MSAPRTWTLLLCFFVISSTATAQMIGPTAASTAAPSVPAAASDGMPIVQKALAAINQGRPITDITLTGTARRIAGSTDETGTVVLKARASGEARIELNLPSGPQTQVYANSDKGPIGAWSGSDGVLKPIPLYNVLVDPAWFSPPLLLSRIASANNAQLGAGAKGSGGAPTDHVLASKHFPSAPPQIASLMERHSQMDLLFDPSTSLLSAVSFKAHPDIDATRDIPVDVRFSDYRAVDGTQTPFRIQQFLNGGLVLDIQVETVNLNSGLPADSFHVPEVPAFTPVLQHRQ